MMKSKGIVYLVGAGPGDVGLLTMRGAELLGRADVVVYDALVNPDLLRLAPKSAEIIYGGKRAKDHAIPQEELNLLLVHKAREGKTVVRLKGGDPYVFGRGGEEAEELATAHIPFEVVPGISSIVAGPNYAGIPITHRDHCSSFTVVTGHEDPPRRKALWITPSSAKLPGTKVILMGVDRIRQIAESLVAHGMSAETPGRHGPLGHHRPSANHPGHPWHHRRCRGQKQFHRSRRHGHRGCGQPARQIELVRETAALRPARGRDSAPASRPASSPGQLLELGADVLEIPTIKIEPPSNRQAIADALLELNSYDWLVFTSPNGVTSFFDLFLQSFRGHARHRGSPDCGGGSRHSCQAQGTPSQG